MHSSNSADYQHIPRAIGVMTRICENGLATGWHAHRRGQVLYATSGLMLARTEAGAWAVPTGHALLIPPGLRHDITMYGEVAMLTAYIAPAAWEACGATACRVVHVSRLLDTALEAMTREPKLYGRRGGHLAALVLDEVKTARVAELALPLPATGKLKTICAALLARPGMPLKLDDWAERLALSRRTLTRKFRQETGLSFGQWRRRLRRLHSMQLAAGGSHSKDIAASVGYRSTQALQAMIRREHGRAGAQG